MNWKTIKTFLIFMFLAIDIFLVAVTYRSYTMAKLNDKSIADTLTILERNNIKVDSAIIPKDATSLDNIQLTNLYYSIIASPYKSEMMFTDDGKLSLNLPANNIPTDKDNISDYIAKNLSIHGFDINNIDIQKHNNEYTLTYKVNKLPVFNNIMSITADDNRLKLLGQWYVNEKENTYTGRGNRSVYATSPLTELISHPKRNPDEITTITDISIGYYADAGAGIENIKIISASPCYRLTTDSGKVYYYSITDNKFIN